MMIVSLIENVVKWLNAFPTKNGLCDTMSPSMIILGKKPPDMKDKSMSFGSHIITYTGATNTLKQRGVLAIALNEPNDQGGYYFMSLDTGHKIHSYEWKELPIPDENIITVEEIAEQQNDPLLTKKIPSI